MKHGFLVLLSALVTGAVGFFVVRHLVEGPPSAWLCNQYQLSPEKSCRIETLQKEYGSKCGPFCDQMCQANTHLEQVALDAGLLGKERSLEKKELMNRGKIIGAWKDEVRKSVLNIEREEEK